MEKIKTLFTGDYVEHWQQQFSRYLDLDPQGFALQRISVPNILSKEEVIRHLKGKEAYLIGYDPVSSDVLDECPDLKFILSVRDGPEENIDLAACTKLGIPVLSSAGRGAVAVAEFTLLEMLLLARPMAPCIEKMRKEGWTKENAKEMRKMHAVRNTELYNKNLGIIGFGRNARSLARMVSGLNMHVSSYDPYVSKQDMAEYNVEKMELADLCKNADYLVVLARLNKETERMLTRELIFSMKPTASIVNTGRAKLVDNDALFDALEQGVIKSAAIDVHEPEPPGALNEHRMYSIPADKLVLTPHAAGNTLERPEHQYELLYTQLLDFFHGRIPKGCVNKVVFDTPQFKERGGKYFGILNKEEQ